MTQDELDRIRQVNKIYDAHDPIPCTKYGYCMPCPDGVDIPNNPEIYSECVIFGDMELGKVQYNYHTPDKNKAAACITRKTCKEKYPPGISVSEWMQKIHEARVIR